MAEKGEKISQNYIIPKIDAVTNEFTATFIDIAPSVSDIEKFKDKFQQAISDGLYEYVSNEYDFDVKTNGLITLSPPPPGATVTVTNYAVEGNIIVFKSDILSKYFKNNISSETTGAVKNMTDFFNCIFLWLPKVANVTGPVTDITINPIQYLSTVTGVGTIIFPNFISSQLARNCVQETSAMVFVDKEGNLTGKTYKDVWGIIGKYIYQGLDGNIIATVDVGTANTSQIPNGLAYAGVSNGTAKYK